MTDSVVEILRNINAHNKCFGRTPFFSGRIMFQSLEHTSGEVPNVAKNFLSLILPSPPLIMFCPVNLNDEGRSTIDFINVKMIS